jgi:uncharacterized protein YfaP (DUF2135 family)
MSILNNQIRRTLTASGGSDSDTFSATGICQQIYVKPATSSTQYDVTLTDSGSTDVYSRTSEESTMNEFVTLPVAGAYTISIANATVDEAFEVLIVVRNS